MSHKIILLNGPPRSGKDTAADYLLENLKGSQHLKFAEPLRRAVPAMYGISEKRWDFLYHEAKELPCDDLLGLSVRQAMISASEDWMKPLHGADVFGKIAAQKIKRMRKGTIVISDCGFDSEVAPLVEEFGARNLLVIAIKRKGCNFKNDSRGYIEKPARATRAVVKNDSTVENFQLDVFGVALDWLESVR